MSTGLTVAPSCVPEVYARCQDISETKTWGFDCKPALGASGDSPQTAVWTAPPPVTVANDQVIGQVVKGDFAGGADGQTYRIYVDVTTTSAQQIRYALDLTFHDVTTAPVP